MATDLTWAHLDDAVVALARRMGRRGVNEATVWTLLRAQIPGVPVEACAAAVRRLVESGRLYRHHRRTRTMLLAAETSPATAVAGTDPQASLFDELTGDER